MRFYVSKFPCFLGYFCKGINLVFLHADDNRRVWVRCGKMPFLEKEKKIKGTPDAAYARRFWTSLHHKSILEFFCSVWTLSRWVVSRAAGGRLPKGPDVGRMKPGARYKPSARRPTLSLVEMLKPAPQYACALTEYQKHLLGTGSAMGSNDWKPAAAVLSLAHNLELCLAKKKKKVRARAGRKTQQVRKVRQIGSLQAV